MADPSAAADDEPAWCRSSGSQARRTSSAPRAVGLTNADVVKDPAEWADDLLTLGAAAALAYVLSMLAHESLGHGGACLIAGGRVVEVWALDLRCELPGRAGVATRAVAAAGPLVPLLLGLLLWTGYQRREHRSRDGARRGVGFTLTWLCSAFLVLPNLGYFCLAATSTGDWAIALRGAPVVLRLLVSLGGAALYWLATRALFRAQRVAIAGEAYKRGRCIAWIAYATANALAAAAGARQAGAASSAALSGWSGVVASLAGTSGLVWGVAALRRSAPSVRASPPLRPLSRSWPLIALATLFAAIFIAALGPGVRLAR